MSTQPARSRPTHVRVCFDNDTRTEQWLTLEEFARLFVAEETMHAYGPGVVKVTPIVPSQAPSKDGKP